MGEQEIPMDGKSVPVAFAVPYDPSQIQDNHRYSLRAEIRDAAGKLLFTTDTVTPVITGGNPTSGIELILVQVRS
jgi:putative lipoprotein